MFFRNLETDATMTGEATTALMGIGGRATVMFLDEFSRVRNGHEIIGSTRDTAYCRIFNSTHVGPKTAFNKLATNGVTDKIILHWSHHPGKLAGSYRYVEERGQIEIIDKRYDFGSYQFVMQSAPAGGPFPGLRSVWYDKECLERGSSRAVSMDLDIDVHGSMSLYFEPLMIQRLKKEYCRSPDWEGDVFADRDTGKISRIEERRGGFLKLWGVRLTGDTGPPPARYSFGMDVSQGTGATPSCLAGLNCKTGEKVVEYANARIDPKHFAALCVALALLFKDEHGYPARLIWEQQGPGVTFGERVLELNFRNVYFRSKEFPLSLKKEISDRPGWVPTQDTKELLLAEYRSALATQRFINRSEWALEECLQFRYGPNGEVEHAQIESDNDPSGARVNHADRVIADALAWKFAKDEWREARGKEKETPKSPWPVINLAYRRKLWEDRDREREENGSLMYLD